MASCLELGHGGKIYIFRFLITAIVNETDNYYSHRPQWNHFHTGLEAVFVGLIITLQKNQTFLFFDREESSQLNYLNGTLEFKFSG